MNYDGYWINDYNSCVIGLRHEDSSPLTYKAYVIEQRSKNLFPGMVMAKFIKSGDQTFYTDYYSPYNGGRMFLESVFRNDTVFTTGAEGKWRKIMSYSGSMLDTLSEYNYNARGRMLDSNTYLITLPINSLSNGEKIDSLLNADSVSIHRASVLILDVRNNVGGKTSVYLNLLPYIYTNPIIRTQVHYYVAKEELQIRLKGLEELKTTGIYDTATINTWVSELRKLEDSIGKFVLIPGDTIRYEQEALNPKLVGVIINYACQSASEMMLLEFMQSKKVTLFGETTKGAVDYLDRYSIETPSGKYKFYLPSTRRVTSLMGRLDGKGILPHIHISDNEKDWVQFVKRYYENK